MNVPTTVERGMPHLDYLLDEALSCLNEDRVDVAVTHLSQAVRVAAETDPSEIDRSRLDWLVRGLIASGGGFA